MANLTLDKDTLQSAIHYKLESFANITSDDPAPDPHVQIDELSQIYADEIEAYIKPLLDAYNALKADYDSHVHGGVIVAVVGQATGTIGKSGTPE